MSSFKTIVDTNIVFEGSTDDKSTSAHASYSAYPVSSKDIAWHEKDFANYLDTANIATTEEFEAILAQGNNVVEDNQIPERLQKAFEDALERGSL